MSTPNNTTATPVPGQAPATATPAVTTPAGGNPAGAGNGSNTQDKVYVQVEKTEWENTQRDAARHRSRKQPTPLERRENRYAPPAAGVVDDQDQKYLELSTENQKLARDNMQLKVTNELNDLFNKPEYKNLPESTKKLILRNPLALADERAKTHEDIIADIEDFIDDEIGKVTTTPSAAGQPPVNNGNDTPPPSNNPPAPINETKVDVTGLTGPARSIALIKGLFGKK